MKFRVTCIASDDCGRRLGEASNKIQDWLNVSLGDGQFGDGIDQFTIVAISVYDEPEENMRYYKGHNKTGRYKDFFSGAPVRYISRAVLLPPASVLSKKPTALLSYFCKEIVEGLVVRPARIPKGFDYERCSAAISKALVVYDVKGRNR